MVSNLGQTTAATSTTPQILLKDYTHAQGFSTGSRRFVLTGIEVDFHTGAAHPLDQVLATVNRATESGTPGDVVAGLTATPAAKDVTLLKPTWASQNTVLEANTDYVVVLWAGLADSKASVKLTDSDAEDSGGESGWSIADGGYYKERGSRGAWTSSTSALEIRVKGSRFLEVADAVATEGTHSHMSFLVTLSKPGAMEVTYYTVQGTAVDTVGSGDYVYTRGKLSFSSSQTTATIRVPIVDDDIEDDGGDVPVVPDRQRGRARPQFPGDRDDQEQRRR